MEDLNKNYVSELEAIKAQIQASEELAKFLEDEEDDDYRNLVQAYEGPINTLYETVANDHPLQLVAFEEYLLDEGFEGLYLPRVLGYSVLRGRINDSVKYYRPQNHFKNILEKIINSSNFEQIKQRIGQSIQIGFALSSDIWITNIIESITNKKVKSFLQTQKLLKYRDQVQRNSALVKFRKQFQSLNFQTAVFPQTASELLLEAGPLKDFLVYRAQPGFNNENIKPQMKQLIANEVLFESPDFFELCILIGLHYDMDDEGQKLLTKALNAIRNSDNDQVEEKFFTYINDHDEDIKGISVRAEKRIASLIDRSIEDGISAYYNMLDTVIAKGYVHTDAINDVREYYYKHEGLSIENESIRRSILAKLGQFLNNLEVTDYHEYFEINKIFTSYMEVFSNQKFNQELKTLSLKFIKKCLKNYKDKRSKEYQEIKKFVKITFVDFGFMTDKQVTELFKTKRKPKTV
ncbi:MAG: hypothetical protein HKN09_09210 [Saprospiraceae bacterium]|nr:hypothetical protein [Saprospiraceae bacterium]